MTRLRFLLLEDSLLDTELVRVALSEGGVDCELLQVDTQAAFVAALETKRLDLILSDYSLPSFDGTSALAIAQRLCPELPFIIVSGTLGEELAIETLKSGATDYVLKQRLGRLVPSVQRALREARERRNRQQAEAAARLSENRYRTLTNAVPQLMWVNSATGETEYLNKRWRSYAGVQAALPLNWSELIHPDDLECSTAARDGGLRLGEAYELECRLRRVDRCYRWHLCRVVPMKDDQGQVLHWVGTATDIEDIKQVEFGQRFLAEASVLLTASLNYTTTLENIARLAVPFLADFCFFDLVAPDGSIQRAAWHHRDSAKQEWFAQVQHFVPPQDFTHHPILRAIATGQALLMPTVTDDWMQSIAFSADHLQFMRDLQFHSQLTVPLTVHDRRLGALTCYYTAESERHYAESELRLAEELAHRAAIALDSAQLYQQAQEANRIKDEFLAVLSHELRTPLNPILGWSKLLRSKYHDKTTLTRGLETIERNAQIQIQLIEDLLDVSRILSGKLNLRSSPVNLVVMIESALEIVRLAAEAKAIDLQFSVSDAASARETAKPHGFQVMGDSSRLQQVIWNLLSNAVKFTPNGGRVTVRLEPIESESDSSSQQDSYALARSVAQITVTDTGKGIPAHFLPYVFDYFRQADGSTTRSFGGLGLGLAIVRNLVELHGGTVQAESSGEGQGATFRVKLPLIQESETRPEGTFSFQLSSPPAPTLTGLKVLVVDDEKDTLELITFLLEESGAIVTATSSVREALAALERVQPSLLISDIGMPHENGYMLLNQVRSGRSANHIPAIALSAYAREEDRQQAMAVGFQSYLTKPIEPEALISEVTRLVEDSLTNLNLAES